MSLMICPKAKWCLKHHPEYHLPNRCPHVDKHRIIIERGKDCCNNPSELCPACIPVEPKQQCTDSRSLEDIEQCCGEQPTPTMPLREQEQLYGWDLDKRLDDFKTIAERLEDENYHSRAKAVLYLIERCKRAEAHDSEVAKQAVKEFADKVCEDMPLAPFIGGLNPESPEAFDLLKKGIALRQNICNWVYRAMAEKE